MVILIAGTSHTGKTLLAQKLLEKYKFPYLSIDHLKMGLIRSKNTTLTVENDKDLTEYLWKIVKEIVKTNIENKQNIIIEGCYIPLIEVYTLMGNTDILDKGRVSKEEMRLALEYIRNNYDAILRYENSIEQRKEQNGMDIKELIEENNFNLQMCKKFKNKYILIKDKYDINLIISQLENR